MDETLYLKIYSRISGDIRSGALAPHSRLPSKRELCRIYGVSQSTAENAYGILAAEGYIYSEPKRGYFVCPLIRLPQSDKAAPELPETEAPPRPPISLSTNDIDTSLFPFSSWAKLTKETVYNNPQLLLRGETQGDIELREALCAFLREYRGVFCTPRQIVIGAGMDYLLETLLRLLPQNAVFGLENPGYQATYAVIGGSGRKIVPISVDAEGMSVSALAENGADIAYVTPSHQFPMGTIMPASRRTHLLSWAYEKDGRFIIEDDYDSEFRYASRPVPAMQGMDERSRVIYIGTFSRSLAPSIRVAYTVLPPSLLAPYAELRRSVSSTVSRFEQHTLASFISRGLYARHLRRAGNLYGQKQSLLRRLLAQIDGLSVQGDEAGLHFLARMPGRDERELVSLAAGAGIGLCGLSPCWRGGGCPDGTVIIGFGGPDAETLKKAAEALSGVWK